MGSEDAAVPIMRSFDADYVMVVFGGAFFRVCVCVCVCVWHVCMCVRVRSCVLSCTYAHLHICRRACLRVCVARACVLRRFAPRR